MKRLLLLLLALIAIPFACASRAPETEPDSGAVAQPVADCDDGPLVCFPDRGINPTKAALALAMARELRRWDPARDLTVADPTAPIVLLSPTSRDADCRPAGCPNVQAVLGLQYPEVSSTVEVGAFDPAVFRASLVDGIRAQVAYDAYLAAKQPELLAPAHSLEGEKPRPKAKGQCGQRFTFKALAEGGKPLRSPELLRHRLIAFGGESNPYLAFDSRGKRVGIDPAEGDNAGNETTSGSCPTYELDRVYNPTNSLLGTCCVTTYTKSNGALQPIARAAGYLGCKAGVVPTK